MPSPKKKTTFSLGLALSGKTPVTEPVEIQEKLTTPDTDSPPVVKVPKKRGRSPKTPDPQPPAEILPAGSPLAFLDAVTTPEEAFNRAARELGFPPHLIKSLLGRVREIEPLDPKKLRRTDNVSIIAKIEHVIENLMDHMDSYAMGKASVRDLAVAFGIMVEKRQLLKGEPTQVISIEDRRELPAAVSALLIEARRRNIPIELSQTEYAEIIPTHRASVSAKPAPGRRTRPRDYDTPTVKEDRK